MANRISSFFALGIAGIALLGCQQDRPALTVEQAKQITASFEGRVGFVPPPKSAADVIALLEADRPDQAALDRTRRAADARPPVTPNQAVLAEFYRNRADAAGGIGRTQQYVADARLAYDYIQPVKREKPDLYGSILLILASSEYIAGNYESAKRAWNERISFNPGLGYVRLAYNALTTLEAQSGNLAAARENAVQAEKIFNQLRGVTAFNLWGPVWTKDMENARAQLALAEGKLSEAEVRLRNAAELAEVSLELWPKLPADQKTSLGSYRADRDNTLRALAEVLMQQGRLVEAEVEARRALTNRLKVAGKSHPTTAHALNTLASILIEQGRFLEAEKIAAHSLEALRLAGVPDTSRYLGRPTIILASAYLAQGRYADALKLYEHLAANMSGDPGAIQMFIAVNPDVALARLKAGDLAVARKTLEDNLAEARSRFGSNHRNTAEVQGLRAIALAKQADPAALEEFRNSSRILLSASRQVDDDITPAAIREQRLRVIIETYMALLAERAQGGQSDAADEAFRLADAIRSQGVQRAIAASSARLRISDPALADLVRREQDAKAQIGSLFGLIVNVQNRPADQRSPNAVEQVRKDIDALRNARAALRQQIEREFPDYANLIDPRPATIAEVRAALNAREALLATYSGDERTFLWAISKEAGTTFASVPLGTQEISRSVERLRSALDVNADTLGDIPAFDLAEASRLFQSILKPVEAGWRSADHILVVPHGALGQLPLGLLPTALVDKPGSERLLFAGYRDVPWLIRKAAITQLPSVPAFLALKSLPPGSSDRRAYAGIGDPYFSKEQEQLARQEVVANVSGSVETRGTKFLRRNTPNTASASSAELGSLPRLPDTADEVRGIAAALNADPSQDVFLGRRASEAVIRSGVLSNRKVIVFATHGLVPGDLNGLTQPALALSSPALEDTDGDGLLTVEEILGLKLDADWVVLSACNTAAGDGAGAEAVSGLGRAFFYAGARALLVSNWPVETQSARLLTTHLFRLQAERKQIGRAEAARQAMVALIDGPGAQDGQGRSLFAYSHPIFWAPFSVVGDGN